MSCDGMLMLAVLFQVASSMRSQDTSTEAWLWQ